MSYDEQFKEIKELLQKLQDKTKIKAYHLLHDGKIIIYDQATRLTIYENSFEEVKAILEVFIEKPNAYYSCLEHAKRDSEKLKPRPEDWLEDKEEPEMVKDLVKLIKAMSEIRIFSRALVNKFTFDVSIISHFIALGYIHRDAINTYRWVGSKNSILEMARKVYENLLISEDYLINITEVKQTKQIMKTALVIYTNTVITDLKEIGKRKKYTFNVDPDTIKQGDLIKTRSYETNIQVVTVLDKLYKYYNSETGDLANEITSTKRWLIRTLEIAETQDNIIYGEKIN